MYCRWLVSSAGRLCRAGGALLGARGSAAAACSTSAPHEVFQRAHAALATADKLFQSDGGTETLERLENEVSDASFWELSRGKREKALRRLARLREQCTSLRSTRVLLDNAYELYKLAEAEGERRVAEEAAGDIERADREARRLKVSCLFTNPLSHAASFVEIQAGAGGQESTDWAAILFRMYSRWAHRRGISSETVSWRESGAGIRSAALRLGDSSFGWLNGESGVHRLVRISPFDASARRHTTFASVRVTAVRLEEDTEDVRMEDVRFDTYRSSGAGGQHVNTTDSAVRATHVPTGISVQCQSDRSQHRNKASALEMLRARVAEAQEAERANERQEARREESDIAFGSQIRSYVLYPYRMVKDVRTGTVSHDPESVLDGDIDEFLEEFLLHTYERSRSE